MNNDCLMGDIHDLIRSAIRREQEHGKSQSEIAHQCRVSQSAINKYIKSAPSPTMDILRRFSEGLHIPMETLLAAEGIAPYGKVKPTTQAAPTKLQRLITLAQHLDRDELATLERCAEAFQAEEPEVRQHLIGQLKIIERLVHPGQAAPAKEKKRHGSPS